jgi:hypothetical protein
MKSDMKVEANVTKAPRSTRSCATFALQQYKDEQGKPTTLAEAKDERAKAKEAGLQEIQF